MITPGSRHISVSSPRLNNSKWEGLIDHLFLHAKTAQDFSWHGMCAYIFKSYNTFFQRSWKSWRQPKDHCITTCYIISHYQLAPLESTSNSSQKRVGSFSVRTASMASWATNLNIDGNAQGFTTSQQGEPGEAWGTTSMSQLSRVSHNWCFKGFSFVLL